MNKKLIMKKLKITLKSVDKPDHRFLYELLKERGRIVNISHKQLPTFQNHIAFVNSKPYSKWYIIKKNNTKVGSIYLTKQDEIGIFIKKKFQGIEIGKLALEILIEKNPRKRYLANVNPSNKRSIEFFKKRGFKLIQYTYEFIHS